MKGRRSHAQQPVDGGRLASLERLALSRALTLQNDAQRVESLDELAAALALSLLVVTRDRSVAGETCDAANSAPALPRLGQRRKGQLSAHACVSVWFIGVERIHL